MEIIIRGDKIEVTKAMKDYINEKLERLEKYLENSSDVRANVVVKVKGHFQTVEITIPLHNFIIRSEETQDDFYASVDKAIDSIERQIRKNKTKIKAKGPPKTGASLPINPNCFITKYIAIMLKNPGNIPIIKISFIIPFLALNLILDKQ